jgi:hypothetical protein
VDVLPRTTEEGTDPDADDLVARFLAELRNRQDATWAVVCQGRIVVETEWIDSSSGSFYAVEDCTIYLPERYRGW